MFPISPKTRSMMDYDMEINRLFNKNNENAHHLSPSFTAQQNLYQTPVFPTLATSSSSGDSMSPQSPPLLGYRTSQPEPRRPETPQIKRQRPIVGRRILDSTEPRLIPDTPRSIPETRHFDLDFPMRWNHFQNPQEAFLANYQLFPELSERVSEKSRPNFNVSPSQLSHSSGMSFRQDSPNLAFSPGYGMPMSPILSHHSPPSYFRRPSSLADFPSPRAPAPAPAPAPGNKLCTFCRKNGETPLVYTSHMLKERAGGGSVVACPILRNHTCDTCGATGDHAHTKTYCPVQRSQRGAPLQSTTIILKNTRVKSNGRRRY